MTENSMNGHKLWGGRFENGVDPLMEKFNASIPLDKIMWAEDIEGSLAYAKELVAVKLLTKMEYESIVNGFTQVKQEWESNSFQLQPSDEDIHTANERRLTELIGDAGKKLHTGRSRNDQVATDVRLWLRKQIVHLVDVIKNVIDVISKRAEAEIDVLMPGYTHLQRAQPIRWSHWLLSYAWMLMRDLERLREIYNRVNVLPLGSGALAGNPFLINRQSIANDMKFNAITMNSMDGTSDRDFIIEFFSWASLLSVHLSRFAEDVILYSTKEFGYITLSDLYSTGSSLMPQKKNPDSMELMRGKAGRIIGKAMALYVVVKGLPMAFNKDLQEDKCLFEVVETVDDLLGIAKGVISTLKINKEKMHSNLSPDMLATDLAYYLVRKGVPFREAHHVSGECVQKAENQNISISELSVEEFRKINKHFGDDVTEVFNYENSVEQYAVVGGTSRVSVNDQVNQLQKHISIFSV